MAGELLVRILKNDIYEKALSQGPISQEMESKLFQDENNWNLREYYGPARQGGHAVCAHAERNPFVDKGMTLPCPDIVGQILRK